MKISAFIVLGILAVAAASPALAVPGVGTVPSADSLLVRYEAAGSGTPALVFVHGWCCDRTYWKHQIAAFSERHAVVAIDLAGHGESGLGRAEWTVESFAHDVAAVVASLGLERVILIGHSMGGPVALEAARLVPDRVIGVVGIDTFQDLALRYTPAQSAAFIAPFEAAFAPATDRFVRAMFPRTADSALVAAVAGDMASAPPAVGVGALRNLMGWDPASALEALSAPLCSINSDRWPTNEEGNRALVPSYRARYLRGLGHFVQLEDPQAFNRALEEVIAEIARQ